METDGQGRDFMRREENEFEELPSFYIGHSSRNIPAATQDIQELRGTAGIPQRERLLQDIHGEPDGQMQADSPVVQRSQGQNFRRDVLVQTIPY